MTPAQRLTRWLSLAVLVVAALGLAAAGFAAPASTDRPIGTGEPSADVISRAQARLESDGYLRPGSYKRGLRDTATIAAIKEFQKDHFEPADGELTPDTIGLLTTHGSLGAGAPVTATRAESVAGTRASTARRTTAAVPQEEERVTLAARTTVQESGATGRQMPATGRFVLPSVLAGLVLIGAGAVLLLRRA